MKKMTKMSAWVRLPGEAEQRPVGMFKREGEWGDVSCHLVAELTARYPDGTYVQVLNEGFQYE